MWGTDIVAVWHGETAVLSRLMDFSRSLVDSLPAEHRDNYAFANALRIFGFTGIKFEKNKEEFLPAFAFLVSVGQGGGRRAEGGVGELPPAERPVSSVRIFSNRHRKLKLLAR